MALNASKVSYSGAKSEPLEPNNYPGRVVQVLDLGLQAQRPYQGQAKPPAYEIMLTYELGTEFMKDEDGNELEDKPRWISESFPLFNLASEKAKSTARYKALDPTVKFGGDFSSLVDSPCLVAVVNNEKEGKVYNNVGSVSMPIKGMAVPELKNEPKVFDMDNPDVDVFRSLPEWIQKKMTENLEFAGSKLEAALNGDTGASHVDEATDQQDDDTPY